MDRPALKPFLRVYRRQGDADVHIGVGPAKFAVQRPTAEMERFLAGLDGSRTLTALETEFPDAAEWIASLDAAGVMEDRSVTPDLDPHVARRWSRQIHYLRLFDRPGWTGYEGQRRISAARVVVVGTGAGGTTLLRLLAAAGVGTLEAVDFDSFAEDNLPTHTTLDEEDAGSTKIEAVRRHLHRQSSHLRFVPRLLRVESREQLAEIIDGADFFLQAYDRPRVEAARWSNWAALKTGVPFSSIGVTDLGARVGPIVVPGHSACWECVGIPDIEFIKLDESAALLGSTVAMLAGIMVTEILEMVSGATDSALVGRSLYINTARLSFTFDDHVPRAGCPCGAAG
jgi:molybdopterin-synthase adenylyltransferase